MNIYLNNAIGVNEELNKLNLPRDNFDTFNLEERVELVPIHDHSDSSDTILIDWSDLALHLAELEDPIESHNHCVEKHVSLTLDVDNLLDTNQFMGTLHPPIYSHLTNIHENPEIEVVENFLEDNKVCITSFTPFTNLKEEYFIIHDMILTNVPHRDGSFELPPPRYLFCPWTHWSYLFSSWHEKENFYKDKNLW